MHQSRPAPAVHASTSSENEALTATVIGKDAVMTPAPTAMAGNEFPRDCHDQRDGRDPERDGHQA
jgi:hypothetical protein